MTRRLVKLKRKAKKKRMKDDVKLKLIDATLAGLPLFVVRRYDNWAIATTDYWGSREELFHWKETYNHHQRPNAPTLKEALEMVDAFWDDRVEMPAL